MLWGQKDTFKIIKRNIFCKESLKEKKLSELITVFIVKKGQQTAMKNSIHYKTVLEFDKARVELLETSSLMPAQKNVEFLFAI